MLLRKTYLQLSLAVMLLAFSFNSHAEESGGGEQAPQAPALQAGNTGGGDTVLPDLFTGTMSYKIPIDVPPGRNGMDPGLALLYRSSNGNGWVGMGWELEVGAIERSTKGGLKYDDTDTYLFRMAGATIELVYDSAAGFYRAKIEGAFNRFRKLISPSNIPYWEVTDKKGTKYIFGYVYSHPGVPSPIKSAPPPLQYDPNDSTRIFKWCLNRVEDTNGNYMTFSYSHDQGQLYLDRIDYTGNGSLSPTNKVYLYREDREDAPISYSTNFAVKTAYRLKTIEVIANGGLVRKYELVYDENPNTDGFQGSHISGRSLLTSVRQYGKDGLTTLPDITLKYTPLSSMNGIQEQTWTTAAGSWGGSNYTWAGDFNGDGKTDIATANGGTIWVKRSLGNTFIEEVWATNAGNWGDSGYTWAGDFNGDGKMDIATANGCNIWVKHSMGTSFVEETWATNACSWGGNGYTWAGDFDGDGKTDIATANGGTIWVKRSTGSSFTEEVWSTTASNWGASEFTRVGDFNGDGKMDIMTANGGTIWVKRSVGSSVTGYSFVEEIWTTTAANWGGPGYTWVGDFNGDGRSDIATANGGNIWVKLSTGSSFNEQTWTTTAGNWGGAGYTRTGDFNGDGKTDIATANGGNIWIKRSTGFSFIEESWTTTATNWGGSGYTFSADFNGDGKTDISTANGGTIWVKQSNEFPVDLLQTIENGIGATTIISYLPSTSYSNTQLPFPVQTLYKTITTDGNGVRSETKYSYGGGFYHIGERDFRGFNYVTVIGPYMIDLNIANPYYMRKTTWFHQGNDTAVDANNPYDSIGYMKGKPYRITVRGKEGLSSFPIYSETTISYDTVSSGPYYFNPPKQVDTSICDGDNCGKQTRTIYAEYDSYGNVKTEYQYGDLRDSSDDRSIVRTYAVNPDIWIVGFPKTETVYEGIGASGAKKAETTYYYDDVSDCNSASTRQIPDKGKLTRVVRWNSDGASPEIRMAYNSYGNPICSMDANGKTTSIGYDSSLTFPTTVTNPLSHKATTQYYGVDGVSADKGLYGQVKSVTDVANNTTTSYEYDTFGRRTNVTQPDGSWVALSYNNFGTVGSQYIGTDISTGSSTLSSKKYFDGLGRTILEKGTGPGGKDIAAQTVYDSRGLVSKTSLPYFSGYDSPKFTTYTYDSVGRIIKAELPDGRSTQRCYNDWVTVTIDAGGHKKRETRDAYGRLIKVEEFKGAYSSCETDAGKAYATTAYQYDVLGNLMFVIDSKGNKTEMQYDSLGRKTYMKDPDMGEWDYYYDNSGNLIGQKDGNGRWIFFQYDALNRLKYKEYDNQEPAGNVVYTYDEDTSYGKGRLTSMTDRTGSAVFYYDPMGRVKKEDKTVNGSIYTTRYDYDKIGRPREIGYPDGSILYYSYDGPALSNVYDSTTNYADYSGYNALGQPGSVRYGNDAITDYSYYNSSNSICPDDNYRLCTINTGINGVTLQDLRYTYDDTGNVTGINDSSPISQEMENDRIARLSSLGDMTYTYPDNGTRPHAVASAGGNTYTYDYNGNMTRGAGRSITYNHENMPLTITANGITTSIDYDGFGERIKKTTGTNTTVYINGLYECTNGTCVKYIFANGQRIAAKTASNTYYYHTDHLGSSSVITASSGLNVENLAYYPYGQTEVDTGSANVPYKYTGQELDAETGLYNYNARLYDPVLGRFITADSIIPDPGDPQSFNRYAYVRNNPINLIDPSGHSWLSDRTGININANRVIHTNLGIDSIQLGYYAGYGGEINIYFTDDDAKVGGGVGVGAGFKVGVSAGDVDIYHQEGVAAGVGYDPYGGPYAYAWGGCTLCGGANGSATYYFNSGNYAVSAGYGYSYAGAGVGYSNVGGTTVGGGYGGVGANYNMQTGRVRYSIDPVAARNYYRNTVGYDVTPASGGDARAKNPSDYPFEGANNIGTAENRLDPNGWFNEGGRLSRSLNVVPGINAVAGLHDVFQVGLDNWGGNFARTVFNVPGMIPAAIITYSSFLALGQ